MPHAITTRNTTEKKLTKMNIETKKQLPLHH